MATRRRTRKPAAERRREIARTALDIIGLRGLPALTTTALAEAIGLTSGALFRHFPSREAILDEAVRQAERQIEATFPTRDLPPLERLASLARARIRLLAGVPGIAWLLRSEQALLSLPRAAVRRLESLAARSRAFVRDALGEARERGEVRDDVALSVLVLAFTSTVHALIGQPGLQGRSTRPRHTDAALRGLFQLLAPPAGRPSRR